MMRRWLAILGLAALSACATPRAAEHGAAPIQVRIIAFNDFHGALEPPEAAIPATGPNGEAVNVPAGGAAYFASAVDRLKAENPNHIVVSAGDLISASPFVSSQFLDEPTVRAMNLIGLDLSAVGNHEFDRGPNELLRMQNGGCAKYTSRQPCRVDGDFPGAKSRILAANVRKKDGTTLFPATAIRSFGSGRRTVKIGFIGLTLKETGTMVIPAGVVGLTFEDEAQTINALVPRLRAEGADAVVVLIHQGLYTTVGYNDKSCGGVSGDLLKILPKLDPSIDLIVSGHTHRAYICDYGRIDAGRPFLVTSAGRSGVLLTDIELAFDPATHRVTAKSADNLIVQGEAYQGPSGPVPLSAAFPVYPPEPRVKALVGRYVAAARPIAERTVGHLAGPATRDQTPAGESVLGDIVADMYREATGADIGIMNGFGLRADLTPDAQGGVTYGQLYAVTPFANVLQVKGLTGRQLRALLEQQFASGTNTVARPNMLTVSADFSYSYDLSKPEGQRILNMRLNGTPIADDRLYRIGISNFLASGGDNFTVFTQGTDIADGPQDIDAFEAYFSKGGMMPLPRTDRVTRVDASARK